MKSTKKSAKHEPSLTGVMNAVQDLAEAMQVGFAKVENRFDGIDIHLDGVDARLDGIDVRLDGIDSDLVEMNDRLRSVEKGQAETHRRLDSIERKQDGMLESIDETVHQSEFIKLVQRVELLEK
ncbi:MAG: hypothetical protein Q7S01_00525 [bacterium]|nr:hypothetical protein [bacterium]